MKPLKILQVFNRYIQYGGEEGSVFRIGDGLQGDHEVEYFFGSTEEFMGKTTTRRFTAPWRAFYDFQVAERLRRYQQIGRFDLWQVHNIFPGLSPSVYQVAFSMKVPVLQFLHNYRFGCVNGNFYNHGMPCQRCIGGNFWPAFFTACWHDSHFISGWQSLILLFLRRLGVFQRVDHWIALSQSQKELHEKIGLPSEKISVVPHFYESPSSPPPSTPQGAALFLSRLAAEKGGEDLLRAWQLFPAPNRELWIAGTGPQEHQLQSEASCMQKVRFLGFLNAEEKEQAWANTAFAVIPSLVPETFGMIVLEAWSKKRPVIAYRMGGLAESIDHGINGLLVEPGDVAGLSSAIQRLANNPEEACRMGQAGQKKLLQTYTKSVWLEKMNNIYRRILSFHSRPHLLIRHPQG